MPMNKTMRRSKLKIAIWESGMTQREVSSQSGVSEWSISQSINGRVILTEEEKKALAQCLERDVSEIFD
jgi:DNA-binding XRE family transcriptional regulator